jgi:Ca2+-binding RTX toxin-like protein
LSDYAANGPGVSISLINQANPLVAIDGTTPIPAMAQLEGIIGTSGNDSLDGAIVEDLTTTKIESNNWLIGGSGDDTMSGGAGDDVIIGGSMRLDALIGKYVDASTATGFAIGSQEWRDDAMSTGGTAAGYGNDIENAYSGASNRALGTIDNTGLLDLAGFDKHFTEMLRSKMFRDVTLGDGGVDGTADAVVFSGSRADYTIVELQAGVYKITDNRDPLAVDANGQLIPTDGTDLVTGVEVFKFADVTLTQANLGELLNPWPAFASPTAAFTVDENTTTVGTIVAVDTPPLTYTIAGGLDAALFAIDGSTGALSFVGAPNFETPTDDGADNIYDVIVRATDSFGGFAEQAIAVTVTNANEPTVGGVNISMTNFTATVGDPSNISLNAISKLADGDLPAGVVPTYTWTQGAAGGAVTTFEADAETGSIDISVANGGGGGAGSSYTLQASYTDPFGTVVSNALETVFVGTNGNNNGLLNSMIGTSGVDLMLGLAGNDTISGNDGNDTLFGHSGNDTLHGGQGDDLLNGGANNDTVNGDDGDDVITYDVAGGRDIINGGANATALGDTFVLNGNATAESFNIYTRDAWIAAAGNLAAQAIRASQININSEIIVTRNGSNNGNVIAELDNIEEITINGSASSDPLVGGLIGGDNISIFGDFNSTSLNFNTIHVTGGVGDDTVDISGLTSDHRIVFDGGEGTNEVIGDTRPQDVLTNATMAQGAPTYEEDDDHNDDCEEGDDETTPTPVTAAPTDLTLMGDASDNLQTGEGGDDVAMGRGGSDTVSVGSGDDFVDAGTGDDTVFAGEGNDMVYGGDGADVIMGGDGNDLITAGNGDDNVMGGKGDDYFVAGVADGVDRYSGDLGSDTLDMSAISANIEANLGTGLSGYAQVLNGPRDTLYGIENIVTGSGNDTVTASGARNVIDTGTGQDTVVFNSASDADGDTLYNFEAGDRIDVSGFMGGTVSLINGNAAGAGQIAIHFENIGNENFTVLDGQSLDGEHFKIDIKGHHNLTGTDFAA